MDLFRFRSRSVVFWTRAVTHLTGAIILMVAGVLESRLGVALVIVQLSISAWAIGQLARGPYPAQIWGVVDVLFPPLVGILAGYDPYSLHLLVGAQVAGAFMAPRPRYAKIVGIAAGLGIIGGLVLSPAPSPITLTESGRNIAELGAVIMGIVLSGAMVALLGYRNWQTNRKLTAAAETEHKAAQVQRRFMSMVSHELRTPLTSIQGFAELIADRDEYAEEEIDEFNDAVRQQAGHLSRLVDDLLMVLRVEAGRLEVRPRRVSMHEMLQRIELSVAIRQQKQLDVSTEDRLWAWADPDRLFQVLRNLVENADKYGGDHILLDASRRGEQVRIVVSDDGDGIPAEMVEAAFDEFVQLRSATASVEGGFGLGLSIVRSLIDAMGGAIHYTPVGESDSRFVIDLPSASEEETGVFGTAGVARSLSI